MPGRFSRGGRKPDRGVRADKGLVKVLGLGLGVRVRVWGSVEKRAGAGAELELTLC